MLLGSKVGTWNKPINFLCANEATLITLKNYDLFNFFHNKCVK